MNIVMYIVGGFLVLIGLSMAWPRPKRSTSDSGSAMTLGITLIANSVSSWVYTIGVFFIAVGGLLIYSGFNI